MTSIRQDQGQPQGYQRTPGTTSAVADCAVCGLPVVGATILFYDYQMHERCAAHVEFVHAATGSTR